MTKYRHIVQKYSNRNLKFETKSENYYNDYPYTNVCSLSIDLKFYASNKNHSGIRIRKSP